MHKNLVAALIFLPGIKGSLLKDPRGEVQWLNTKTALSLSTPRLSLPMRFDPNSEQARDELTPAGILESVTVIPRVVESKVYGPFLAAYQTSPDFISFSYDWRRELAETKGAFLKMARELKARSAGQKIQAIGHSMGGLILWQAALDDPELFDKIVLVGSPLRGGIGFLPDLHDGVSIGLNSHVLSPEVLATFPSVYTLFGLDSGAEVFDEGGRPLAWDIFDPAAWRAHHVGLFGRVNANPEYIPFLAEALRRAKSFREQLRRPIPAHFPKVLIVASDAHPTLKEGQFVKGHLRFDVRPKVPGDDRVPYETAFPHQNVPYTKFETMADHSNLLNDPKVQAEIRGFLGNTR